eukprot:scaffold5085_cov115-Cylindrotheca_fusiformis.AAC.12
MAAMILDLTTRKHPISTTTTTGTAEDDDDDDDDPTRCLANFRYKSVVGTTTNWCLVDAAAAAAGGH